jgi:hypothetical protein
MSTLLPFFMSTTAPRSWNAWPAYSPSSCHKYCSRDAFLTPAPTRLNRDHSSVLPHAGEPTASAALAISSGWSTPHFYLYSLFNYICESGSRV